MAKVTIADALTQALADLGVTRVYGITGDSLNAIADSIRRRGDLAWIHTRHEEAAAFAAASEAHLTGRLAVCAGSCGPGNLHLVNGLYDAYRSRVPVLAIAAHVPSAEIGSQYFQETHPTSLFRECSSYVELVSQPEQFPHVLEVAIRTAIGQRTVATVVLPGDLAWLTLDSPVASIAPVAPPCGAVPSEEEIRRLAALLNGSPTVTILAGAGCADAHDALMALAGALKAPIVHSLRGKESVEPSNPFDVGMTGLIGFSSGYHAMMNADTLLLLGTDFPYRQFYPEKAKVVQIDCRPEQIGRRTRIDLGIVADVGPALAAVLPRLAPRTDTAFLDGALEHYRKSRAGLDSLAVGEAGKVPIHPQFLARSIDLAAAPDAIFTCDVGTPTIWAARYLRMNGRRRLVGSFSHGSMANALPHAIGAQAAFPRRQVVSLSGDGGLSMLLGELLTLVQHELPVKVVVFDNGALGFVEMEMKSAGLLEFATGLGSSDFAGIARAAGLLGIRVERPEEVAPALEQAFAHPGPALVDVAVNRFEIAKPPKLTWGEASGFSLFLAKAILNGQGSEVVDIAKTEWFR